MLLKSRRRHATATLVVAARFVDGTVSLHAHDAQFYTGRSLGQYTVSMPFCNYKPTYQYVKVYRRWSNPPSLKYAVAFYNRRKRHTAYAYCGAINRFLSKLTNYIEHEYRERFNAFWYRFPKQYRNRLILGRQGFLYGRVAQPAPPVRMLQRSAVRAQTVQFSSYPGKAQQDTQPRRLQYLSALSMEHTTAMLGLS